MGNKSWVVQVLIVCVFACAVFWRWTMNARVPSVSRELDRQTLLALAQGKTASEMLPGMSWQLESQWFDPDAEVLIGVGPDGQPGRLNVDDENNGVVDNVGEMGAVGSDDECAGPLHKNYTQIQYDPRSIVVGRGAFRNMEPSEPNDSSPDRYLLIGELPSGEPVRQLIIP